MTSFKKKFYIYLVAGLLVFLFNISQNEQLEAWENFHYPLADNIYNMNGYYRHLASETSSYPIWGYPLLSAVCGLTGSYNFVIFAQFIFYIVSVYIILKEGLIPEYSENKLRFIFFNLLLFFYASILSLKATNAPCAFLLFLFAYFHLKNNFIASTVILGIFYNFRVEGALFLMIYLAFIFISRGKTLFLKLLLLSVILILPWPVFQYYKNGIFTVSTTNSGGVMLRSLGQLPDNKWLIKDNDFYIIDKINSAGIKGGPWGIAGDDYLKREFYRAVNSDKAEYLKKIIHNFKSSISGGFYVPEINLLFYDAAVKEPQRFIFLDNLCRKAYVLLNLLSSLVFIYFIFLTLYNYRNYMANINMTLFIMFSALQIILCSLGQYNFRHISQIMPMFIFLKNK